MGAYSTGSATIVVGSQTVTGNNTRWDIYISPGHVFKLISGTSFYDIADVVSSCELTLTARYSDTSYETSRISEHVATVNLATKTYSGTIDYSPVIRNTFTVLASDTKWSDNGAGVLATEAGAGRGVAGVINYDSGSWSVSVTSTTNLTAVNVTASYHSGNTLNSMPYQIVVDYTPNYDIPEIGKDDANVSYTLTKALRTIDSKMYNATTNTATTGSLKVRTGGHIQLGSHQYVFFGSQNTSASVLAAATAIDASVKGSMYLSSAGSFWKFVADDSATQV